MFVHPLIASFIVALISLIGILLFGTKSQHSRLGRFVLPTAIGVFLGVIFFELIPETIEGSHDWGPIAILTGFLGFYLLSQVLDTYHHHHHSHDDGCAKGGARRLLIGDGIHNFADGIVIASAFMINPAVGIATTIGIALHEIPQEIAEYGILIHSGYSRSKALLYNFFSASTVIVGTGATLFFSEFFSHHIFILTGIAAGNLLYIATADLIPELREQSNGSFMQSFIATVVGVVVIAGIIGYSHEYIGHDRGTEHESSEYMHDDHDEHEDEHDH